MMETKTSLYHCLNKKAHKSFLMLSSPEGTWEVKAGHGVERSVAESGKRGGEECGN